MVNAGLISRSFKQAKNLMMLSLASIGGPGNNGRYFKLQRSPTAAMNPLTIIENAFSDRRRPDSTTQAGAPIDELYEDALAFQGKAWQEVTCAQLEKYRDAPFAFNPEAFCYFLPGIYSASIRENRTNLIVIDSIIGTLNLDDLSNADSFFCERWSQLNVKEYEATRHWLLWIASADPQYDSDILYPKAHNPVSKAFDIISYLIDQKNRKCP